MRRHRKVWPVGKVRERDSSERETGRSSHSPEAASAKGAERDRWGLRRGAVEPCFRFVGGDSDGEEGRGVEGGCSGGLTLRLLLMFPARGDGGLGAARVANNGWKGLISNQILSDHPR